MKIAFLSVSAALAASSALLTFGPAVVVLHVEPLHLDLRNVTDIMLSVTARDPNIMTTELKGFAPPKKHVWLDAKVEDIDPLFMRLGTICPLDDQFAGLTKMSHGNQLAWITKMNRGGGSGGITYADNGGGSQFIDHLKSGRFTVGGGYLVGAGESFAMTSKNLSG